MSLFTRLSNKSPSDFIGYVLRVLNKYILNGLPRRISPFVNKKIKIVGKYVSFITHKNDKILGARLRGELRRDNMFLCELKILSELMKPGVRVLDAGANIGSVAVILAIVEPNSEIFCFEPDALNYSILNINLALNKVENIHTFNYALGEKREYINMFVSPDNFGDHRSVGHKMVDLGEDHFSYSKTPVLKVNPRELLENMFPKVESSFDIIKIDTQGADFEILEECIPLLKKNGKVAIEFSPYHLIANGTSINEVLNLVNEFSHVQKIVSNGNQCNLELITLDELDWFFQLNQGSYNGYCDLILTY